MEVAKNLHKHIITGSITMGTYIPPPAVTCCCWPDDGLVINSLRVGLDCLGVPNGFAGFDVVAMVLPVELPNGLEVENGKG